MVPTGASQFHAGDPAYFYFEAYEPLLATAKPDAPPDLHLPLIGIRIRVLDRATGQQKSDTGARSAGTFERAGNATVPVISVPAHRESARRRLQAGSLGYARIRRAGDTHSRFRYQLKHH